MIITAKCAVNPYYALYYSKTIKYGYSSYFNYWATLLDVLQQSGLLTTASRYDLGAAYPIEVWE